MKIYIDSEYRCYATNPDGTFCEVEHPFFDGMCAGAIECYRYVPQGESWERSDGEVFDGETITLCKDYDEMDNAQREYERQLLVELQENSIPRSDLEAAYQEGVNSAYD